MHRTTENTLFGIALLCGCTPSITRLSYTVRRDEPESTLGVRMCFEHVRADRLVPANSGEGARVQHARHVRRDKELETTARGIELSGLRSGDCIAYDVTMEDALDPRGSLLPTDAWLWRPEPLPSAFRASVAFELPENASVSTPWPRSGGSASAAFILDRTAFTWMSNAVLDPARTLRFQAGATEIELAVVGPALRATDDELRAWIRDALHTASFLEGADLPVFLHVIVVSHDAPGGGPVFFGMAARGGGAAVLLHLRADASGPSLLGGWTTTHEVLHHAMPFIAEPWMAEGWVSYYTELLRTRAGHRDERGGWQALFEAFERGRNTAAGSRTLRDASATMHAHRGYQRVYWGGAAIAFMTDVALRTAAKQRTLDDAVAELGRRQRHSPPRRWNAAELLQGLDVWHGEPVFTTLARTHLDEADFPDVESTLAALGVGVVDGEVILDDAHPHAAIRRAIMAPREEPRRDRSPTTSGGV